MQSEARFGGHFVQVSIASTVSVTLANVPFQGHVDTTATILSKQADGNSIRFLFQLPESASEYQAGLIEKGYVTIDGTSLTLTSVDDAQRTFGIMLIAHTQERVIITDKKIGDRVNIEIDVVTKAVSKIVNSTLDGHLQGESKVQSMIEAAVERALKKRGL